PCAAANPAIALWLQSTPPAGRVAELGSLGARMSTVSEQYFLDYCKARRYKVKRITLKDKAGRFPDYETTTPAGSVIVEIKEFTPNDEDNAFAATLEKEGKASVDNRSIGRRVRKAIIDSAPQLRRYQDTSLPEILLLY